MARAGKKFLVGPLFLRASSNRESLYYYFGYLRVLKVSYVLLLVSVYKVHNAKV